MDDRTDPGSDELKSKNKAKYVGTNPLITYNKTRI